MSSRASTLTSLALLGAMVAIADAAAAQVPSAQPRPSARRTPAGTDATLADRIQAGDRKGALDLIASGADVNRAQPDGTTPLQWAVYRVDRELVDRLLKKGAKANVTNGYGASPLHEAVRVADVVRAVHKPQRAVQQVAVYHPRDKFHSRKRQGREAHTGQRSHS